VTTKADSTANSDKHHISIFKIQPMANNLQITVYCYCQYSTAIWLLDCAETTITAWL